MTAADIIAAPRTAVRRAASSRRTWTPSIRSSSSSRRDLLDVCRFLRDDPRLQFDMLNCISGVDYLEPDPKKAPKAGFEPHLEVVYHLSELHAIGIASSSR